MAGAVEQSGRLGRPFAGLWASATASALSTGLVTVAAPLLVASVTSSPLVVSGAFVVAWLPWLLFALPGGVLVDRVDRRRLMIGLDWGRVGALAALALAIGTGTGTGSVAVVYAVLFVVNTCEIVARSASQAMVPAVVGTDQLERANGWLIGSVTLMQGLVAGPLGGLLFVAAAALPFLAGAGGFAVSALLLTVIAGSYRAPRQEGAAVDRRWLPGVAAEVAEAFRWLMQQRLLRTMAVLIGLLNLTLTAATAVLVLVARDRLGLDSVGYGLLFSAMGVGGILGSVLGERIIRLVTPTWTIRIGLLVEAGLHLALATSRDAVLIGVAFAAFGVHGSLWGIVGSSLRQRLTPPHMLGRVGSTTLFIAAGGNCVGALMGGVLASAAGLTAPYWVGFVVAVLVSAGTWRVFDRASVQEAYALTPTSTPTSTA